MTSRIVVDAVTAHDSPSVERSVLSNNAPSPTSGRRATGVELARTPAHEGPGHAEDSTSAGTVAAIGASGNPAHESPADPRAAQA